MGLFTVGHSTRSLDELVDLLRAHDVALLGDVRTVPASRRVPHFGRAVLAQELPERGVEYQHLPALGGLRRPRLDSPNTGWRNQAFRGFADHMATGEFRDALDRVVELGRDRHVALMCAEAVPWRCHRSLIADALTVRGLEVRHILGGGRTQPHALTPFARLQDGLLTYPGVPGQG